MDYTNIYFFVLLFFVLIFFIIIRIVGTNEYVTSFFFDSFFLYDSSIKILVFNKNLLRIVKILDICIYTREWFDKEWILLKWKIYLFIIILL